MHPLTVRNTGLYLKGALFSALLLGAFAQCGEMSKRDERDLEAITEAVQKLEWGVFGRRDEDRLEGIMKKGSESLQPKAAAVLSRYQRTYEQDYVEALLLVSPFVLETKTIREWEKAQKAAVKEAQARWKEAVERAKHEGREPPPEPTRQIQAAFPPVADWTVTDTSVDCAVEVAFAHWQSGQQETALQILGELGRSHEGLVKVLVAEASGDITSHQSRYEQAVDFYRLALDEMEKLRFVSESEPKRAYTNEERKIRDRISQSLHDLQRRWDIERYGEGFVVYREAEWLRREKKQCVRALLKYRDLAGKFPKTVYSEAAEAYSIKCLLALADETNVNQVKSELKRVEYRLEEAGQKLKLVRAFKVKPEVREEAEATVAHLEERIKTIKGTPLGEKALEAATERAEAFITANEFGLYRGEVMLDMGKITLHNQLDIKSASHWYSKADVWFSTVNEKDAAIDAFSVPGKAIEVSSPPPSERRSDGWGNAEHWTPKTGSIFNRNTCQWYLSSLQKNAIMDMGLIAYVGSRFDDASKQWSRLYGIDPFYKQSEKEMQGSTPQRLLWNVKNNRGALMATTEELAAFRDDTRRLQLMLADLAFECENFSDAAEKYNALLQGRYGELTTPEKAFVVFALAQCEGVTQSREAALGRLEAFNSKTFLRTPTAARALMARAGLRLGGGGKDNIAKALSDYKLLIDDFKDTPQAKSALLAAAFTHKTFGRLEQAKGYYQEFVHRHPEDRLTKTIEKKINQLKIDISNQKGQN